MSAPSETVILVHGLWMRGPEMWLLRRRLEQAGYSVHQFSYRTTRHDLDEAAARLNALIAELQTRSLHLVAHSLGGLVVRQLFHDYPQQPPGRIVTLGTPHGGSYVARRLARSGLVRTLLGASLPALRGELPVWHGERQFGSIAGSRPIGVGRLAGDLESPNDGTVAVAETVLDGMSDHRVVPTSHFGLLFSRRVATSVIAFLRHGGFDG